MYTHRVRVCKKLTVARPSLDGITKPEMSYSPIRIRFTRSTDQTQDDVITITPSLMKTCGGSCMTEYKIVFTAANCESSSSKKNMSTQLPARFLEMYLKSLLRMIENDTEPYLSVQLDMPLVPTVLFDPTNLGTVINPILDNLLILLTNWPTHDVVPLARTYFPRKQRTHLFFDDDGEII